MLALTLLGQFRNSTAKICAFKDAQDIQDAHDFNGKKLDNLALQLNCANLFFLCNNFSNFLNILLQCHE
ncbi:hypothetical protein EB118_16625 [bacterium]|nr:hypothetical protein [bacterium]NDC95425.1 hypothetical protein [bacterium]NDD85158.1 hypothetical protein [bacterium]NDG31680.1 hypothetical protein [bacterium]